ncbi:pantoate--beta-alanine ligase [Silanimonas sp.]|uniref:pantoate--beta-alanine ligase n=1 Tax=Silanimonas sp. TaxID=1929290 RepID=UPI001BC5EA28|nr:pantoate--beta-alanine ligase [Silanimonas sp.]MBS3896277.1 pantoate--beta-alanine ligase [Silanimonas sp.]MBS3924251.1 pantoate--beta-alanine ligase [Xanthomonadaceae bacterium]
MIRTVAGVAELRAHLAGWRERGQRIALVPTMGNLHPGHHSLIELARRNADRVVASVFVNPTQFGPDEDFARYPRTPEADAEGLARAGCDLLFLPGVEAMYPLGVEAAVRIRVPGLADVLEGAARPGHFDGVASVVARLFNLVRPDVALFGRKDYQQLQVIRHLVRDLAFAIDIVPGPTVREPDGLAMSSRNQYLGAEERRVAVEIIRNLRTMREQAALGLPIAGIEQEALERLAAAGFAVDYAVIRRADLGRPEAGNEAGLIGLIAARLGRTRLIDNLAFDEPLDAC